MQWLQPIESNHSGSQWLAILTRSPNVPAAPALPPGHSAQHSVAQVVTAKSPKRLSAQWLSLSDSSQWLSLNDFKPVTQPQ